MGNNSMGHISRVTGAQVVRAPGKLHMIQKDVRTISTHRQDKLNGRSLLACLKRGGKLVYRDRLVRSQILLVV